MALAYVFDQRGWDIDRCNLLEKVLIRWPDSSWALREAGSCWQDRRYPEHARARFERAEQLEPGSLATLSRLFSFSRRENDLDAALLYATIMG